MKFRIIYTFAALLFAAGMTFNFSRGPANNGLDRTGSPISANNNCTQCHTGTAFEPDLLISLIDAGGNSVTEYIPGETYELVFNIGTGSAPSGYGLQATVLDGDANNVGAFGTAPMDMQITDLGGVNYLEHSKLLTEGVISVEWTAPVSGTEDVTIYASGMAANGNGRNGGDGTSTNSLLLMEGVSSTNDLANLNFELKLMANPVVDQLPIKITSETSENLQMNFVDISGKIVQTENVRINQGEQTINVNLDFDKGIYFVQMSDGKAVATEKILKL